MINWHLAAALLLPVCVTAQTPACTSPGARDFDFWLGDWHVEQRMATRDGSWLHLPATTRVTRALNGCALIEEWQGEVQFFWEGMTAPQRMHGLSVRAFDPTSGTWRIHWMDTRSPLFAEPYVGRFAGDRGEFVRELVTPQGPRRGRILFLKQAAGQVRWELATSADSGRTWTTLWTMQMRRRGR
jgi:hypothetical protein